MYWKRVAAGDNGQGSLLLPNQSHFSSIMELELARQNK